MEWLELLQEIFQVCVIPLLGVLTTFAVKFLQAKTNEFLAKENNETLEKYIAMLSNTVKNCVIATNQTYVDALKDKNAFDAEAQKMAFEMTKESVLAVLGADVEKYLTNAYGDLDKLIMNMIESQVKLNK